MSTPTDLQARYGAPAPWRRTVLVSAVSLLGVAFVGFVLWAAVFHSTPDVQSSTTKYDVVDDHTVTVEMFVDVADGVTDVECKVRAMSVDKAVVGELTFTPIQGAQEVTVRTDRLATSADAVGCRTPDQPRWR